MSKHLPIHFTVTDISDLHRRPFGTCQWTVVQIKHKEIGSKAVGQTNRADYSGALMEKREIERHPGFDPEVDEVQIYRITRES